ncbi:MAG: hypothetical protein ACKODQ_06615, partial [Betaproteobacteria bacterium]
MLFTFSAGPVLVRQMVVMVRDGLTFSNPDRWADTVMAWLSSSVLGFIGLLAILLVPVLLVSIFEPLSLSGLRHV